MKSKKRFPLIPVIVIAVAVLVVIGGVVWRKPLYNLSSHLSSAKTTSEALKQLRPIADAAQTLKNTPSEYEEIKIDEENSAILESKQSDHLTANFLWFAHKYATDPYSLDYTNSFISQEESSFIFKKDGKDIVITIEPTAILPYNIYQYYRYASGGWLIISVEQEASKNEMVINNGISGEEYVVKPLYSGSCNAPEIKPDNQENNVATIKLIGIQIGESITKIPSSEVNCFMDDGRNWETPRLSFQEYDPDYSTLKLGLPDESSVLLDLSFKKIVREKKRYNSLCRYEDLAEGEADLFSITPSGTILLVKDVWNDPVFKSLKKNQAFETCLGQTDTSGNGNPIFTYSYIYPELVRPINSFEFDLKTHKFIKVR